MNAGAYGGEMKQVIQEAAVFFPQEGVRFLTAEKMAFGYRHSLLTDQPEAVVLYAVFRLAPGEPETIRETMRQLMERRKMCIRDSPSSTTAIGRRTTSTPRAAQVRTSHCSGSAPSEA